MHDQYPEYAETAELGNKGRRIVEHQIHEELGWIFREIQKDDLGVDGLVEIIDQDRRSHGRTFAVQIKCGSYFFREETETGYIYRGSLKHLNYWMNHSLKVVLVLCNADSRDCYWMSIDPQNVERHAKGWSIVVPKSNTLTASAKWKLESIVESPQASDVIPLALYRLLIEKFPGIQIAQILETPHDFTYFTELARYNSDLLLITYIYKPTRAFEVSDVEAVFEGRRLCGVACGWDDYPDINPRTIIFFVAHTAKELDLSSAIKDRLAEREDMNFYRILCNVRHGVSLNEIDDEGGVIQLYDANTGEPETFGWTVSALAKLDEA